MGRLAQRPTLMYLKLEKLALWLVIIYHQITGK